MSKTAIILEHKGGRLGNQLWNYASVSHIASRKDTYVRNITFTEYANIFDTPHAGRITDVALKYLPGRVTSRFIALNSQRTKANHPQSVISSGDNIGQDSQAPFYLPPSKNRNVEQNTLLAAAESALSPYIYFSGWLFRNPIGMAKYHKEISAYFKPSKRIHAKVATTFGELRSKYKHIIGVHIRKGDYKKYWGGRFYFTEAEIRPILDDYITQNDTNGDSTVFVVCSDESINATAFEGLNVHINNGSIGEDLFALASCDAIIGSDSTFGAIAAYLGNIPIVFFSKESSIDWRVLQTPGYNYHNGSLNIQH